MVFVKINGRNVDFEGLSPWGFNQNPQETGPKKRAGNEWEKEAQKPRKKPGKNL